MHQSVRGFPYRGIVDHPPLAGQAKGAYYRVSRACNRLLQCTMRVRHCVPVIRPRIRKSRQSGRLVFRRPACNLPKERDSIGGKHCRVAVFVQLQPLLVAQPATEDAQGRDAWGKPSATGVFPCVGEMLTSKAIG